MIHNGPKTSVENYYFFVQKLSRLLKSKEVHWSTGNLGLIFFLSWNINFYHSSSFFWVKQDYWYFRYSRNPGKILKIPKKCVRSKCFSSENNYCIVCNSIWFTLQLAIIMWFAHWVICPQSFPLHFYILDNLGLLTRPFCVPNDRHGWQGWTDMRNGTNLDKCGNRFNLVRSSSSGK